MAVIRKHISFDEFIFNQYLSDLDEDNFSKHIQKLVVLGTEALNGDAVETKRRLISTLNENERLNQELKLLKMRLQKNIIIGSTRSNIIDKYQLEKEHIDKLEIVKAVLKKDPSFLRGQFDLFRNTFNIHSMRFDEFKKLIEVDENTHTEGEQIEE